VGACYLYNYNHAATVVLVRGEGTARTGERYQLKCSVYSNVSTVVWIKSGQLITSNGSGIFLDPLTTDDNISSSVLIFDPLAVSHEGSYTCQTSQAGTTASYTYFLSVDKSK